MKNMLTILALLTVGATGCMNDSPVTGSNHASDEPDAAVTDRIDIPPTVRSNLGITFAKVERRDVSGTIRIPGAFELQPLARQEYRMTLPGRVELLVDHLQTVEPGTPLYRFRSPSWPELQHEIIQAEQSIDSAQSNIEVARATKNEASATLAAIETRMAVLAEADFKRADLEAEASRLRASLPRLDAERRKADTALTSARRSLEHAVHVASTASGLREADLTAETDHDGDIVPAYRLVDWIDVRATAPGVVETLAVTQGAFVEPPAVVVSTVDPDRVRFRALALQADLPRLSVGAAARIVPPMTPGLNISDSVGADLRIGLEAHPEQRTVTLLATPMGTLPWIRPGVSAFLEVVVESSAGPALAVPRSSIVKDGLVHVLFRRDPSNPNKAIRVEADLGASDGRWVAISSGLMASDEVVLDGAYELKLASQQAGTSQKGGHFHADGSFHGDD